MIYTHTKSLLLHECTYVTEILSIPLKIHRSQMQMNSEIYYVIIYFKYCMYVIKQYRALQIMSLSGPEGNDK